MSEKQAALEMIAAKLPLMPDPDAGPEEEIEIALTWREVSQIKHALFQKEQD